MKRYFPLLLLVGLLLWQPAFAQDDNGTCIACHAEAGDDRTGPSWDRDPDDRGRRSRSTPQFMPA